MFQANLQEELQNLLQYETSMWISTVGKSARGFDVESHVVVIHRQ